VSTTAFTPGRTSSNLPNRSRIWAYMAWLTAFTGGRFSVTTAAAPVLSTDTLSTDTLSTDRCSHSTG